MPPLFIIGLGLAVVGGYPFLLSHIAGEIPAKWPFEPINRHDEPERFAFWQDVSGGVLALGVILLLAFATMRKFGWPA
jgi:hypothetical protein